VTSLSAPTDGLSRFGSLRLACVARPSVDEFSPASVPAGLLIGMQLAESRRPVTLSFCLMLSCNGLDVVKGIHARSFTVTSSRKLRFARCVTTQRLSVVKP
jgi:hypothetical protein